MANRSDDFNRADGAIGTPSDGGSAWVEQFGTWTVASNRAAEAHATFDQTMASLESGEADGIVKVKLPVLPAANMAAGIIFRSTGSWGSCLFFEYHNGSGGFQRLGKYVAGTRSFLTQSNTAISAGDEIEVRFTGDTITCWINGVQNAALNATESHNNTQTHHGLWDDGTTNTARLDDFSFTGSGPAPATEYDFTGPTSGVVNVASTNFTVTPDGDADGITVTPASDGSGSFTPSSVTFTGSGAETFTYTPTSTSGSPHTLSVTDDGGLTDPATIDYTVTSGAITCTDQTAGRIYQRTKGTTAKTVSFAGTYSGTAPTTVEIRIVAQDDGATIQDWTAISSPTIGGGNWSGTLSVNETGEWLNFLSRGKDGGGSVLYTSSQTSNKWGVGILVALCGQSNMQNMNLTVSTPPASSDLTRHYLAGWGVVTGNGSIRFANLLQAGCGLLVGVVEGGMAATSIDDWISTGANIVGFLTQLTAAGGDCEFILWHQGESDAIDGTSKATYKAGLDQLYLDFHTATGRNTSELKFGCALVGSIDDDTATDATMDAVRQGQLEWIDETTGAFHAGSSVDMVRNDDYHWTAPYYERMGRRYAQAILHQLGDEDFGADGPVIASGSRMPGVADVYLTVTHDDGTALEELDGSTDGGSLTGFQVSDDDFSTLLTISSTAFISGKIRLTLSTTPADGDTIKVRYQYGENPTISNPVYDDTVPQSDTIGLPLQPTAGSVTVNLVTGGGSGGGSGLFRSGLVQ